MSHDLQQPYESEEPKSGISGIHVSCYQNEPEIEMQLRAIRNAVALAQQTSDYKGAIEVIAEALKVS